MDNFILAASLLIPVLYSFGLLIPLCGDQADPQS